MNSSKVFSRLAMSSIVVALASCSDDNNAVSQSTPIQSDNKPKIIKSYKDSTLTPELYKANCLAAGKYYEIHSTCSGTNSCQGTSFSYGTVIENTCKGVNTCAGASCVDMPVPLKTGAEVYKEHCSACHGDASKTGEFTTILSANSDTSAKFGGYTDEAMVEVIQNGYNGKTLSGENYVNMPSYKDKIHPTQVQLLIDYIKPLKEVYSFYEKQK